MEPDPDQFDPVPEPEPEPETEPETEVDKWLHGIDLHQYADAMKQQGFHALRIVSEAFEEDIIELIESVNMPKIHANELKREWAALVNSLPGSRASQLGEYGRANPPDTRSEYSYRETYKYPGGGGADLQVSWWWWCGTPGAGTLYEEEEGQGPH